MPVSSVTQMLFSASMSNFPDPHPDLGNVRGDITEPAALSLVSSASDSQVHVPNAALILSRSPVFAVPDTPRRPQQHRKAQVYRVSTLRNVPDCKYPKLETVRSQSWVHRPPSLEFPGAMTASFKSRVCRPRPEACSIKAAWDISEGYHRVHNSMR